MSDAARTRPAGYTQIRVREPAGERSFSAELSIGGEGAQVVVPGVDPGAAVRIERREAIWTADPAEGAEVRFDGRPLAGARDLRRGDVLTVGAAQIVVSDVSRTLLRLHVDHLVGNQTIAPVGAVAQLGVDIDDEDLEIRAAETPSNPGEARPARTSAIPARTWLIAAGVAVLALVLLLLGAALETVALDVQPSDARVSTPGTLISLRSGDRMLMLPGRRLLRAEREGYVPAQVEVNVVDGRASSARMRLAKLPGRLNIDTGGIAATVRVDGIERGRAPGELQVPAGSRTLTIRAPRYLDYVSTVNVEGAGQRQDFKVAMKPAWGTVSITAVPAGAQVEVDGKRVGAAPLSLELMSGLRQVRLSAPGLKSWESSIVVRAGAKQTIGPVTLGQPDARVAVRSSPAGAEVAVGGALRGRTPLTIELPPGMEYDISVQLPGHAPWTREVFAEPGSRVALNARLAPILAPVAIQGEPGNAELFIDGVSRGRTPQTLKLTAVEHRVEIRKEGFLPFTAMVTPAAGLERSINYRLTSADRATALMESAPVIRTKSGYALRLVPSGTFNMGSERREQGRRPNEGFRRVSLKRPFYIGVTEVTNEDFRRFKSAHASGFVEKRSLDLDDQPVARVSWEDAAEYCNWLSEQEGLPPAYRRQGQRYALTTPVTTGYRLPTEAEWEYAARYAGDGVFRRFAWGSSLPVAASVGNLAGAEAESLPVKLEGYRDEYPVAAPVGKFTASPLGLHDLSGNLSEWVNDLYLSFVDSVEQTDPLGPAEGSRHVVRGPSWQSAAVAELRLAWRDSAEDPSPIIGFRVARYAE